MQQKEKQINDLSLKIYHCKKCQLWETKKNYVVGNGSCNADILFIGEAPGYHEDQQGIPFVGRAGKVFDELLQSIGLKRDHVYVCNILKCRPPGNRNPYESEITACTPFLDSQIDIIKPSIIGTLGNFASSYILKKFGFPLEKIGANHGKVYHMKNLMFESRIIPLYHPASVVYNTSMMSLLLNDFQIIAKYANKIKIKNTG
ncbi:MAG: uracil-DNA glycosylase [Thermoplasmatota archaeon]